MNDYERGRWDMFELITSVYHGKQYYFLQDNDTVYSRESGEEMQREKAYGEFQDKLGYYD